MPKKRHLDRSSVCVCVGVYSVKRALHSSKRALHSSKRALYTLKRALLCMLCVRVREKSKAEKEAARPSAPSTKLKKKELHDDLDMAEKV